MFMVVHRRDSSPFPLLLSLSNLNQIARLIRAIDSSNVLRVVKKFFINTS